MATQNAQMTHKIAVVDEVKTLMGGSTASIVSEYRGLSTSELADLRSALANVGGDYKIFKNTLVRRAIDGSDFQPLAEYLSGPTALTSPSTKVRAVGPLRYSPNGWKSLPSMARRTRVFLKIL